MSTIKLGYARMDITPLEPVPLRGYGNTSVRIHENVLDPLYATCLSFQDEKGETALIFAMDLCSLVPAYADSIREELCAAVGLAPERILCSCTHNHSSPDPANTEQPTIPRYIEYLKNQMIAAAKASLADMKPATAQIGRIHTNGMNFVRRYVMADGTYAGDNYGRFKDNPIAFHESEVDNCLQLVKFTREGGKDVVIANFQMHPHRTGGYKKPDVSADITGAMRKAYEEKTGALFAYFTGGSGNVNGHSRIKTENVTPDYQAHGAAMAEYALKVTFRDAKLGELKAASKRLEAPINHDTDPLLPQAKEVAELWKESKDYEVCKPLLEKYGLNSVYQAMAIVARVSLPETLQIPMWTLSIGDVAFVGAPYEMFDTNGQQIKDASPFKMTFVLTCTNEGFSYMPSKLGFAHGGYSADNCRFKPGIGEMLAENYIELLESMC